MIFRQTALERLSSPEQLDQAMKVTRPTGWLALGSLAGLLLAALGWGFFGGISEKVSGMGVFIRTGGVFGVQSVGAGRLMKVLVKPGDLVSANSVIANIILPDLEIRARNAERILSSAQKRYREVLDLQKLGQRLDNEDESFQGTTFESSLRWYGEEVGLLEERLKSQEQLLADGLISVETVLGTRQNLAETKRQQDATRVQLKRLGVNRHQARTSRTRELFQSAQEVAQAQQQFEEVTVDLRRKSVVFCTYSGRVIEVYFETGSLISAGDTLCSVEDTAKELFSTVWIPASDGMGLLRGMTVQLVPSGVKAEKFGFMVGTVAQVSPYPSSTGAMKSLLRNDMLVKAIESQGPSIPVHVDLVEDKATRSGYKWTSSRGPDLQLSSGAVCSAYVIRETVRPITLVVPTIKRKLGI